MTDDASSPDRERTGSGSPLRSRPPPSSGADGTLEPLSPEVRSRVRFLELQARKLLDSVFTGEKPSIFKGPGLEFSEVRDYQPGDDARNIDWNVTARRDRPYVKTYVEEKELDTLLVVDRSASGLFGTGARSYHRVAEELAALVALAAVRSNDRVGLLVVTDRVEHFVPSAGGRKHALRLISELVRFRPEHRGTELSEGLKWANRAFHRRTVLFLISDFVLPAGLGSGGFEGAAIQASRRHDLVPIRVRDEAGEGLPDLGWVLLVDPESGERTVVNSGSSRVRESYGGRLRERREEVRSFFESIDVRMVEVESTEDPLLPVLRFFWQRARYVR